MKPQVAGGGYPVSIQAGRTRIFFLTAGSWIATAVLLFLTTGWLILDGIFWILGFSLTGGLLHAACKAWTRKRRTWVFPLIPLVLLNAYFIFKRFAADSGRIEPSWLAALIMILVPVLQVGQALSADWMVNRVLAPGLAGLEKAKT